MAKSEQDEDASDVSSVRGSIYSLDLLPLCARYAHAQLLTLCPQQGADQPLTGAHVGASAQPRMVPEELTLVLA